MLKSRRQVLHRRTGEVLRDQLAPTVAAEPELLAHHFTQAGLTEAAIEWWGKAGQRSLARAALLEGKEQLKRALDQIATYRPRWHCVAKRSKIKLAFGNALTLMGYDVGGKERYDRALAIYDPAEHRPLTTRSGRDVRRSDPAVGSFGCVCGQLGYPAASRNEGERAVNEAREIGHAATLMYALWWASWFHMFYGHYAEAQSLLDELAALADEKDASLFWKATEIAHRGALFALTGKASDAVRAITSGMTSLRSTGAALYEPWHLWHLAMAYAELGQPDDARRCIDDAIDKVERVERKMLRWPKLIALPVRSRSSHPRGIRKSGKAFRVPPQRRPSSANEVVRTSRSDEHGAAGAITESRSKLANCSLRSTAGSPKGSTRAI